MEETKIVGKGMTCKCPHHKVMPIIIILIGVDFFLGAVGVLTAGFVSVTWPILLIILGCVKMVRCGCCSGK
jgi:hypothetical protein